MKIDTGTTAWMLAATALVLLMTPGLAFFYGGMTRAKSVLNMMMMTFVSIITVTIAWVLVRVLPGVRPTRRQRARQQVHRRLRRPRTAEPGRHGHQGRRHRHPEPRLLRLPAHVRDHHRRADQRRDRRPGEVRRLGASSSSSGRRSSTSPSPTGSGAAAGWSASASRTSPAAPSVHINAGAAGLALALVLGKRVGWRKDPMRPHNLPLVLLGAGLLWFGWFGFNAGSELGRRRHRRPRVHQHPGRHRRRGRRLAPRREAPRRHATTLGAASGAVAGLVAITPACGFVAPWAAHRRRPASPVRSAPTRSA